MGIKIPYLKRIIKKEPISIEELTIPLKELKLNIPLVKSPEELITNLKHHNINISKKEAKELLKNRVLKMVTKKGQNIQHIPLEKLIEELSQKGININIEEAKRLLSGEELKRVIEIQK